MYKKMVPELPRPTSNEVGNYLKRWNNQEKYNLQEKALEKLFLKVCPGNKDLSDILIKASVLNDFYSTNIFSVLPVAQHILDLDIDSRLKSGDVTLVDDIMVVTINGVEKRFYSFATKYCNHHNPSEYPIYDKYVCKVLIYFRDKDKFAKFKKKELKKYEKFKSIMLQFQSFYGLSKYSLKEIDKYIWQLGKEYFPKNTRRIT